MIYAVFLLQSYHTPESDFATSTARHRAGARGTMVSDAGNCGVIAARWRFPLSPEKAVGWLYSA